MHSHLSLPLLDQYFPQLWLHLICLFARKGAGDWLWEDPELSCKAEEACVLSLSKTWMLFYQSSGPLLQSPWFRGIWEFKNFKYSSNLLISRFRVRFPFLWLPCLQHTVENSSFWSSSHLIVKSEPDSKLFLPSSYRRWVSLCAAKEGDFHVLP